MRSPSGSNVCSHILLTAVSLAGYQLSRFVDSASSSCCVIGCVVNYQIPDAIEFYECNCATRISPVHSTAVFSFLRMRELFLGIDKDVKHQLLLRLRRFPEKYANILHKVEENLSANVYSNGYSGNMRTGSVDAIGSICFVMEMLKQNHLPNARTWTILFTSIFRSSLFDIRQFVLPILRILLESNCLKHALSEFRKLPVSSIAS
jgi:hypothetical protein